MDIKQRLVRWQEFQAEPSAQLRKWVCCIVQSAKVDVTHGTVPAAVPPDPFASATAESDADEAGVGGVAGVNVWVMSAVVPHWHDTSQVPSSGVTSRTRFPPSSHRVTALVVWLYTTHCK